MRYDLDILEMLAERHFSFADLARLTGVTPSNIHSLKERGYFDPEFEPKVGAGGNRETPAYTGIDVLRLHLIAHLVHYRLADETLLEQTIKELDRHIWAFMKLKAARWKSRTVYPVDTQDFTEDDEKEPPLTVVILTPKGRMRPRVIKVRNTWKEFRPGGPWCYLTLDLHTLVETQSKRMAKYLELVSEGVKQDKAARDSAHT